MNIPKIPQKVLIPIVFAVGLAIGVGAFWFVARPNLAPQKPVVSIPPPEATTTQVETVSDTATQEPSYFFPADPTTATLNVQWTTPVAVSFADAEKLFLLSATDTVGLEAALQKEVCSKETKPEGDDTCLRMWIMGTVQGGSFNGSRMYLLRTASEGMGISYNYQRLILPRDRGGLRIVLQYSNGGFSDAGVEKYLIPMPNVRISGLEMPDTIRLKNGKLLSRTQPNAFVTAMEYKHEILSRKDEQLTPMGVSQDGRELFVRSTNVGCILSFAADGAAFLYRSVMIDEKQNGSGYLTPTIAWQSSYANTSTFIGGEPSGCGYSSCPFIVPDTKVGTASGLVEAGKTADGESVYVPKDPAHHPAIQAMYDSWFIPGQEQKPPIEEYLKITKVPLFFWKDGFGRWVEYQNTDSMPAVECGKPVIYLYPEKATNVSVRLPSFINVTKSEPTYPQNGWNVSAQPNGNLTLADGSSYGSLYWEGTGVGYDRPQEGFLVKDGGVDSFLTKTLAQYGLNEKESQEFRDFWVPKMSGAPYYRVAFLTSAWSNAAPLFVSPRPQSVIRIFMDWQKLNAPISIEEPKIQTPVRHGFTLVEWGGLLWK